MIRNILYPLYQRHIHAIQQSAGMTNSVRLIAALVIVTLTFSNTPLQAQSIYEEEPQFGFKEKNWWVLGFSSHIPDIPIGMYVSFLRPDNIGWYLDAHFRQIRPAVSANTIDASRYTVENELEGVFLDTEYSRFSVTTGITKVLSQRFAVYCGAGISSKTIYRQYIDPNDRVLFLYTYWINDETIIKFNATAGIQVMIWQDLKVSGKLGYVHEPAGVLAGIGYTW